MNILLLVTPCYRFNAFCCPIGLGVVAIQELSFLHLRITEVGRSPVQSDAIFRDPATDVANLVGAQAALVPDHVWHRLGRGVSFAASGIGRRIPLGQPARAELARGRHCLLYTSPSPRDGL